MPQQSPLEVLIVEDDPGVLYTFSRVLERTFNVTPFLYTARTGPEHLPKEHFDWAIIDGLNGKFPDVAEKLRPTCDKMLILTADQDNEQQAIDLGYDCKLKPIEPAQLIEYLRS